MFRGRIEAIFVGPERRGPMCAAESVRAVPGLGLEGDRYWQGNRLPVGSRGPDHELTLIEAEAFEALKRDYGSTSTRPNPDVIS